MVILSVHFLNKTIQQEVIKFIIHSPLGFHPQVRWPTRCKRCFRYRKKYFLRCSFLLILIIITLREYKDHTNNRKDLEAYTGQLRKEDRSSSFDSLDEVKSDSSAK